MNGLSHGLNIQKPKKPTGPPKPKKPIFGFAAEESDHNDDEDSRPGTIFGKAALKGKNKPAEKRKPPTAATKEKARVNAQLNTLSTLSKKAEDAARAAESVVDPSVYDYDGVWDDMKSVDRLKQKAEEHDAAERKPKYMESLLEAAEIRKRDALRAKERMLQREREAEGDEFADKEKFVTSAYKKQQAELLKMEEEERIREEEMRKKSQGMSSFYRNMLDRTEAQHTAVVAASTTPKNLDSTTNAPTPMLSSPVSKTSAQLAAELTASGVAIDLNEEGQVVDKTQLLSGGLNVSGTSKSRLASRGSSAARQQGTYQGRSKVQTDVRARQTKMVEEQLAAAQKRTLEEEEKGRTDLERQSKSRKTDTEVMGAKERYLQRKREAAAAAAAAAGKK